MMTEEEKEKTIEAHQLEDLHNHRRLRIGTPIYGRFYDLLKIEEAQRVTAAPCTIPYSCGYFNQQTGRFSPYPY